MASFFLNEVFEEFDNGDIKCMAVYLLEDTMLGHASSGSELIQPLDIIIWQNSQIWGMYICMHKKRQTDARFEIVI